MLPSAASAVLLFVIYRRAVEVHLWLHSELCVKWIFTWVLYILVTFRDALKFLRSSSKWRHYFCGFLTFPTDGSYRQLYLAGLDVWKCTTSLVPAVLSSSKAWNGTFHLFERAVWCSGGFPVWRFLKIFEDGTSNNTEVSNFPQMSLAHFLTLKQHVSKSRRRNTRERQTTNIILHFVDRASCYDSW